MQSGDFGGPVKLSKGQQNRGQRGGSEACSDTLYLHGSAGVSGLQPQVVCTKGCLIQTAVRLQSSCCPEKKQGQHHSQQR